MFRIAFLVEDKNLPHVLKAVTGLVLAEGMQTQFVPNAETKGGKVQAKTAGGTTLELFADWLDKSKLKVINVDVVRSFLRKHGGAITCASQVLHQAKKAGLVKKTDKIGEGWIVVANQYRAKSKPRKLPKAWKAKRGRPRKGFHKGPKPVQQVAFLGYIKKHGLTQVAISNAHDFLVERGSSDKGNKNAGNLIRRLTLAGHLKRTSNGATNRPAVYSVQGVTP